MRPHPGGENCGATLTPESMDSAQPLADIRCPDPGRAVSKADTTRIRTVRLRSWDELPDLESAWNGLVSRSPGQSVFQTFPWHVCWWRAFGNSHELLVILGYAGSRVVGIA